MIFSLVSTRAILVPHKVSMTEQFIKTSLYCFAIFVTEIQAQCGWILCSRTHEDKNKVSVRHLISSEPLDRFQSIEISGTIQFLLIVRQSALSTSEVFAVVTFSPS